jgi:hypothetical protein
MYKIQNCPILGALACRNTLRKRWKNGRMYWNFGNWCYWDGYG